LTRTARFIAKQAKLSCQYQVGKDKLTATVRQNKAARDFMTDEIGARTVKVYRATSPATVAMWDWLQYQAIPALAGIMPPVEHKGVRFVEGRAILPSGRSLWYPDLHLNDECDWIYRARGKGKKEFGKKLYGGALLENVSQAMSYDVFMFHARTLDSEGLPLALAVYDEMGFVPEEERALFWLDRVAEVQSTAPRWCADLPCKGEGNVADNYLEAK
jgi:DNA polymerase bacteriophage-type